MYTCPRMYLHIYAYACTYAFIFAYNDACNYPWTYLNMHAQINRASNRVACGIHFAMPFVWFCLCVI